MDANHENKRTSLASSGYNADDVYLLRGPKHCVTVIAYHLSDALLKTFFVQLLHNAIQVSLSTSGLSNLR